MTEEDYFINLAGSSNKKCDETCMDELDSADIKYINFEVLRSDAEVKTAVTGVIGPWSFKRAWYYWVAEGPGIPHEEANELYKKFRKVVRVDGHCGGLSPMQLFGKFGVSHYHIDTKDGLKALAKTIKKILSSCSNSYCEKKPDKEYFYDRRKHK